MSGSDQHAIDRIVTRMATEAGAEIHDERMRRRWPIRELAARSGVAPSEVHRLESGEPGGLGSYARVSSALGLRPELHMTDPRRRTAPRDEDPVHAWMGDVEATVLHAPTVVVRLDEPFQHYQFAGRADLVAWSIEHRAMLHIENRTRFPNLQETFGSFNAKRSYLAGVLADRLGLRGGFATVVHAVVALWSAEVLHSLRLRTASFRAVFPDPPDSFHAWWAGGLPKRDATTLVLLDPVARPRARRLIGLEEALTARPRYRGYAEALEVMHRG